MSSGTRKGKKAIWADQVYRGHELVQWCKVQGDWDLEVVRRTPGVSDLSLQQKRCIVERTFSWLTWNRRMSKDYERNVQRSLLQPAGAYQADYFSSTQRQEGRTPYTP
jgi:transposase